MGSFEFRWWMWAICAVIATIAAVWSAVVGNGPLAASSAIFASGYAFLAGFLLAGKD